MRMDVKHYSVHAVVGILLNYAVTVRADHDRYGDIYRRISTHLTEEEEEDICTNYDTEGVYAYCEKGYYCCDDDTKCCTDGLSVAAVVGIVMASIFLIGMCLFCSILITKKKKLRPNQLVSPSNNPASNVNQQHIYIGSYSNTRGQTQNFYATPYPYGQIPPPYGQPVPQQGQPIPYSATADAYVFPSPSGPMEPPPYCRDDQAAPPAYKLEP